MAHEYELISHSEIAGMRIFMVDLLYRTPHNHKDFELCLILRGQVEVHHTEGVFTARKDTFFLMNSFAPHELTAQQPAQILALQISPDFFSGYYPHADLLRVRTRAALKTESEDAFFVFTKSCSLAMCYLQKEPLYEFSCAAMASEIFLAALRVFSYEIISEKTQKAEAHRQVRFRYLTDAVDKRYPERLLLSDLAGEIGVSMFHLSHFFKESFGMPFQEYLSKVRCEKARQMLLLTDRSLLDISISCGFSDPKYFNRAFRALYGMSPKEYRKDFENAPLPEQQKSMLSTQEFHSPESSLVLLNQYLSHKTKEFPAGQTMPY